MEKTTEDDSGLFELRVNLETCLEEIRLLIDRLDSKVDRKEKEIRASFPFFPFSAIVSGLSVRDREFCARKNNSIFSSMELNLRGFKKCHFLSWTGGFLGKT